MYFYGCTKLRFEYNGLDTMRSGLLSSARGFSDEDHSSDQDAEAFRQITSTQGKNSESQES